MKCPFDDCNHKAHHGEFHTRIHLHNHLIKCHDCPFSRFNHNPACPRTKKWECTFDGCDFTRATQNQIKNHYKKEHNLRHDATEKLKAENDDREVRVNNKKRRYESYMTERDRVADTL